MKKLNKKVTSVLLSGMLIVGSMGMVYADEINQNDPYADNKELQEIFEVYENTNTEEGMLLAPVAPNPTAEENTQINVAKDGNIELKLEENISTGCTWHVTIENEDIAKIDSDEYKDINEEPIPGALGVHIWNFKALKEGTTKVIFKLYQDWETKTVYEIKEYTITVGKDGEKQVYVNPYADNKELQETFKVYENTNQEDGMLLAPVAVSSSINKKSESNLFHKILQFFSNIFSV